MSPSDRRTPRVPSTQFGVAPARATPRPVSAITARGAGLVVPSEDGGLPEGATIGHYELIRELGRGGMGVVYLARDTKLGRRVAIKFLQSTSREVKERFLVEARATAQCNHDNIVIIHEVAEHDGTPYMVLEYVEGKTLRDVMGGDDAPQRLPPSRVIELCVPIARALARAHELGIVHRDLKPENVIVTDGGQVKVLDFGIAKALGGAASGRAGTEPSGVDPSNLTHTREGAIVGTLPYMAPEQMSTAGVDHRVDLWALGIIMWEMLAGRHPVEPLASDTLIENLVTPTPMPSVRTVVTEVSAGLAKIVDGCLDKSRDQRLGSAALLATLLEELQRGRHGGLRDGESPYPGLTAFQEADANRFFGRARDVARGVARIRELPLVGIVGPSGVGKSSFVRAGVGPALKASGERWDILTLRPGRSPLSALASVLERMMTRSSPDAAAQLIAHDALIQRLRAEPGYLGVQLRARARESGGNILVFVDQFEELYTLVPDVQDRRTFTAALAGVADDTAAPLRVVLSMRSDFLDRVAEDPPFMEELTRGLIFLAPPDREGLREALVQPLEMVGHRFETTAMVGDMLDALAETPGALPLLQFAAARLWDARDRARRLLTVSSYGAIGGISGALATHADEVIAAMNATAQRLAQRVFRTLVTPERTRAIVELSDLHQAGDGDELTRVIDQLVAARLLVVQTRADGGGSGSVELVHESLIDRWPTLRRWLDEDQEDATFLAQLAAAAKQWDLKGRPPGLLWRGDAMEEARRWHAQRPRSIPPRDEAFLAAAFALARRGQRMRRVALIAAFAVLGTVAAGAIVAYVRVRSAEETASQESREKALEAQRADAEKLRAMAALAKSEEEQRRREQEAAARALAQQSEQVTKGQLHRTAEELAVANAELERKAREADAARAKAERASAEAKTLAKEAQRLAAELQKGLEREKAKVRALEEEKKRLTTKLK